MGLSITEIFCLSMTSLVVIYFLFQMFYTRMFTFDFFYLAVGLSVVLLLIDISRTLREKE